MASNAEELREALEAGEVALPDDEALFDELAAPRWRASSGGKIQVEPKDGLRDRLGRSPDRADAVVMAWWAGVGAATRGGGLVTF